MNEVNEQVGLDTSFENACLIRILSDFKNEVACYGDLLYALETRLSEFKAVPPLKSEVVPRKDPEGFVESFQETTEIVFNLNNRFESMLAHFKTII